jgi:hypothetical protein
MPLKDAPIIDPVTFGTLVAKIDQSCADVKSIGGKIDDMREKLGGQIGALGERVAKQEQLSSSLKYEIGKIASKVDQLPDQFHQALTSREESFQRALDSHEQACPSREATVRRLQRDSKPPQRRPSAVTLPKLIWWIALGLGGALGVFAWFVVKALAH